MFEDNNNKQPQNPMMEPQQYQAQQYMMQPQQPIAGQPMMMQPGAQYGMQQPGMQPGMQPYPQMQPGMGMGMQQQQPMDQQQMQQQMLMLQQQNQMLLMQNQMNQNTQLAFGLGAGLGTDQDVTRYINGGAQSHGRRRVAFTQINIQELATLAKNMIENSGFEVKGVKFKNQCFSLFGNNLLIVENKVINKLKEQNSGVGDIDTKVADSKVVKCFKGILPSVKGTLHSSIISSLILSILAVFSYMERSAALDTISNENTSVYDDCYGDEYCEPTDYEGTANTVKLLILIQTIIILVNFLGHLFTYVMNNPVLVKIINILYFLNWILTFAAFGVGMSVAFETEGTDFFLWNMMSMMFIQIFCLIIPIFNSRLKLQMNKLYVIIGDQHPDTLIN